MLKETGLLFRLLIWTENKARVLAVTKSSGHARGLRDRGPLFFVPKGCIFCEGDTPLLLFFVACLCVFSFFLVFLLFMSFC